MALSTSPNKERAKAAIIAALVQMMHEAEAERRLSNYIDAIKSGCD
jgi:hypothetical protein